MLWRLCVFPALSHHNYMLGFVECSNSVFFQATRGAAIQDLMEELSGDSNFSKKTKGTVAYQLRDIIVFFIQIG